MMLPVPPYILSGVPLRAVCAVLERCDLFIGNDSGAAHLAAAMECPTVVVSKHPLNGDPNHANSPVRFAPHCARCRVVQPLLGEDECVLSCRASEPHCILRVTSDRVVAAALELLPKVERTSPRTSAVVRVGDFMPLAVAERAPGIVAVS